MKSDLETLLDETQAICLQKIPGWLYADLAKYLEKSPQQVNDWLKSRKQNPNGSVTLGMQRWVAEFKAAQKKSKP